MFCKIKFNYFLASFTAFITLFTCLPVVYASNDEDWQLILYQNASKNLNDTHQLSLYIEEGRYNQMKKWGYIMPDIAWKIKTQLDYMPAFSLSYRNVYIRMQDQWSRDEKRYNLNFFFSLPNIENYSFKNRVRIEYRDKNDWNNWRIRNEFKVSFPYKWTKYQIQPHIVDEFRYSFHTDKISMNELCLLFTASFIKNSVVCFGYRWAMINNEPKWIQYHVLTLGLSVTLD